jgi:hypothetical protein
VRLHSAIGYLTPADRLAGRHLEIFVERDRKLEIAAGPGDVSPASSGSIQSPSAVICW